MLVELYSAFSFDAHAEPDWATQRKLYLEGASFVPPMRSDRKPRAVDTETFLADFRAFVLEEAPQASGFHERIIGMRIDGFGGIAHAFVAFEGFEPADGQTLTRGLDSLQLVLDGQRWRLVSFTTQYEGDEGKIPSRFYKN